VAGTGELRGSPRERALAGFAVLLTEAPWTVDAGDMARLREAGLSEPGLEHAIAVASFFNYFTRVADGTGIDFDYESPLPRISVDRERPALPRPEPSEWPRTIDGSVLPAFRHREAARGLLERWRAYLFERDAPISRRDRLIVARATSEELCDAGAIARWHDATPGDERERALAAYAKKLTLTPWAMTADDLAPLRGFGLSDEAILNVITLVAHQNTIARMHHALVALHG
jgi:alkylhydroperoxidase family enzyme